ncbi:acetyl-CoA acetyltransferase [Kitasatospora sp. NPDC101235]|uniref:acetyl-CoA acetyltransferase n=1 Tax=Kitasatospora sp. NPDC101235 TaxID=3364101 RepID=UPI00381855C3
MLIYRCRRPRVGGSVASRGIRDKVAIVGMGCTRFGDHWAASADDLLVEAARAATASAGLTDDQVDAYWLGTLGSGSSGLTLSRPLRLPYRPVTRVENYCAAGSEALRNACYAVASGAYDVAMAIGVEKLKDSAMSGLAGAAVPGDGTEPELTAPAAFSLLAPAYARKYGLDRSVMREVLDRIAWKNHANGARNPLAHFRRAVPLEAIRKAPRVAGELGLFDCSGVSDGSAAAIVVRAEDAHRYTDRPLYVKALSLAAGPATGVVDPDYDFTTFPEVRASARDAYRQAGVVDPKAELALAEVHDCFTVTELVLLEDLGLAEPGRAWQAVLDGAFDLDGELPVNPDGGLKAFGHPIGASGLRMLFECWLQLRGEAPPERSLPEAVRGRTLAMTQNLGGGPGECLSFVSIVGSEPSA